MTILTYDPDKAVRVLRKADKTLARLMRKVGPCTMASRTESVELNPFQALLRSIVYQQLSGKAAATIHARVLALYDEQIEPAAVLATSDESLRSAGLSRAKTTYIKDLAAKTLEDIVPPMDALKTMEDDAIIERLVQVRGIGRWTVEMILMSHLGRPDVLPVDDLGVRKGYMLAYAQNELPSPKALREYGECWRPYRSVASWYMWRAVDLLS